MEDLAFLARPTAMIAVLAGIIALSIVVTIARRHARKRRLHRETETRGRRIVRKLRLCPFFGRPEDRKLAFRVAKELEGFLAKEGFTLEMLGATRAEVDKLLKQAADEEAPRTPQAAKLTEMMAEHRESKRRPRPSAPSPHAGKSPIILPALELVPVSGTDTVPSETEPLDPFGATFTEADFPPSDEGIAIDMSGVLAARADEDVPASFHADAAAAAKAPELELDLSDFEDRPTPVPGWSDPIHALRSADKSELDAYVDERILAIQVDDKKE
ncbi:MAG TPA: hypothetical protein VL426_05190 [Candidatus Binatia bacterium]|jgi:hypothetical protein|nr:hypothetical protein [Candidatus Binatia bacterium]